MEVADERKARQISSVRREEQRVQQLSQTNRITLDDLYRRISAGDVKELNLILKGDVQGSVQALWEAIEKIEKQVRKLYEDSARGGEPEVFALVRYHRQTAEIDLLRAERDAKKR